MKHALPLHPVMTTPTYLTNIVEDAQDYLEDNPDATPADVAVEFAHQNDHLWSDLRGEHRRDNLEVLQDIRDAHRICADELDTYRNPNGEFGPATVEAIVQRSLEDFIHTQLSETYNPQLH